MGSDLTTVLAVNSGEISGAQSGKQSEKRDRGKGEVKKDRHKVRQEEKGGDIRRGRGVCAGWGVVGGGEKLQFYGGKLNQLCDGSRRAIRLGVSMERLLSVRERQGEEARGKGGCVM